MTVATSRLEQVLVGLEARILTVYPGVTFKLGQKYITSVVESPPRIVWARAADAFSPPVSVGRNPRAVLTRSAVLVAHCWAVATDALSEDAAVEHLVDALAWALRAEFGPEALPQSAEWIDPPSVNAGLACLVAFTLAQPVVAPVAPTVVATTQSFDTSDAVAGDGQLDAGAST